jgi:quinoprotein glucose dehydrogenase
MKTRIAVGVLAVVTLTVGGLALRYDIFTKVQYIGNSPSEAVFYLFQKLRKDGVINTLWAVRDKLRNDPRLGLGYSLYDKASHPPIESAAERNALPEFKTIPGADVTALPASRPTALRYDTWHRSNGDDLSGKYSALDQIRVDNVQGLEVAWNYSNDSRTSVRVESNPIVVNGRLFVAGMDNHLLSLDAATGREVWRVELPGPVARRGMIWEPNPDFSASRLFVPTADGVHAVNAESGDILRNFGNSGQVGDQLSLIAPVLAGNKLIVALVKPSVEAYDTRTGKLLWSTPLLEAPNIEKALLTGGSPWAGMSFDPTRSRVYVSTGNPRPELWGASRPGPNKHSSSVVAIDTDTGKIAWAFQEVAHDLWDLDVPSPPVLTTITKDGRKVDVVAAVTKMGNTLLLDRDFGRPIFDYRMRRAPVSTIPGEQTWPYQPDLELPEPLLKPVFEASDVTDLSDLARHAVTRKIRSAHGGFFLPPVLGGSVVLFGLGGGASWPGGAVDHQKGVLYIPSSQSPWIIRANYRDMRGDNRAVTSIAGNAQYQAHCSRCHGVARDGFEETNAQGGLYYPALTGITLLRSRDTLTSRVAFEEQHKGLGVDIDEAGRELALLFDYFSSLDKMADDDASFAARTFWRPLQDNDGHPGSKPPWGLLTALDLNSGRRLWQVPFGEDRNVLRGGRPLQGQLNTGGAIVTAGGLVFATGTADHMVRAFESASGKELWSFTLPAAGSAPPSTYMLNGRQYVVVVGSGKSRQELVAFTLRQ